MEPGECNHESVVRVLQSSANDYGGYCVDALTGRRYAADGPFAVLAGS